MVEQCVFIIRVRGRRPLRVVANDIVDAMAKYEDSEGAVVIQETVRIKNEGQVEAWLADRRAQAQDTRKGVKPSLHN